MTRAGVTTQMVAGVRDQPRVRVPLTREQNPEEMTRVGEVGDPCLIFFVPDEGPKDRVVERRAHIHWPGCPSSFSTPNVVSLPGGHTAPPPQRLGELWP